MRTRRGGDRRQPDSTTRAVAEHFRVGDVEQGKLGGELTAQGDEGPCDLSTERIRAEGNPDRQGSEWARRRFVDGHSGEGLIDAVKRAQMDLGHWAMGSEDETRIAVETIGTALSWWRERSLETWKLVWLFLDTQQPSRPIGVGWRGVLVIWREPLMDRYRFQVTEEHLRQASPRRDAFIDTMEKKGDK